MQNRASFQATCRQCRASFVVSDAALEFYAEISPRFGESTVNIPPPTLCPACRLQRRMAYRNQMYVFSRPSSVTGKPMFSMYPAGTPFPVVEKDYWWSDEWDASAYASEFSFDEPFFVQFERLRNRVPHYSLSMVNTENSDYCNNCSGLKNCYFVFNSNDSEDCLYCEDIHYGRDCLDCSTCINCELCYDCVDCRNCFEVQSSLSSENCSNSCFLLNCRACRDCFGCANLRHAQYCVFNEQLTEEGYRRVLADFCAASFSDRNRVRERCESFFKTQPHPHAQIRSVQNVSGDHISESRDVELSFFVHDVERAHFCFGVKWKCHDVWDVTTFGNDLNFTYESATVGIHAHNLSFCYECWNGATDLLYCSMCSASSNLFGCVGLRRKEYCILNKQYSRAEYSRMVPLIAEHMRHTGEWGEFFPAALSPCPYNFSLAQRFFPLAAENASALGLPWHDRPLVTAEGALAAETLPDRLPESDHGLTVTSALSGKAFKITTHEIARCRKLNAPLPRLGYDERAEQRWRKQGGLKLHATCCERTGRPLETTLNPADGFRIWDHEQYEEHFSGGALNP